MVELFERDIKDDNRQSSKGNQLKWENAGIWYKADYTGYEGLSEYIISQLMKYSNLNSDEYVLYDTEEIKYGYLTYSGCKSRDFLPNGWKLITLERLFQNAYGESLYKSIYKISDRVARMKFLVEQTERLTGLRDFGIYMSKLMTLDALFLNEDRHTHNIAVLMDEIGNFQYCPIFDNGAALMSDTTMDYPLEVDTECLIGNVCAKTICSDFDQQLDIAEQLYGKNLTFCFDRKDVEVLLEQENIYNKDIKRRVQNIIMRQRRKYQYLFA